MSEVGVLAAFAAGVLALLSPCSALLLPSFFAMAFASKRALVARTLVFYLGLLITLVPLGVGAGAASSFFYGHRPILISVAGWMIIGFGVLQLLGKGFTIPFSERLNTAVATRGGDGWISTLALGSVYGLAGFCSGPVLGAILTVAATQESPWAGWRAAGDLRPRHGRTAAAPRRIVGPLRPRQPALAPRSHAHPRAPARPHRVARLGSAVHRHRRHLPPLRRHRRPHRIPRDGRPY